LVGQKFDEETLGIAAQHDSVLVAVLGEL